MADFGLTIRVTEGTNDGPPIAGATARGMLMTATTDANGNAVIEGLYLTVTADGYVPYLVQPYHRPSLQGPIPIALQKKPAHPLAKPASIRGAMWTQHLNLPLGPRPGQDTNICAMDYYEQYSADDRKRMIEKTLRDGYTHAVTGPIIDMGGYHGKWRPQTFIDQRVWDAYLDCMDEWKANGITPVHFQSPDNWSLQQCQDQLSPFYEQQRARDLLPLLVPHGWEPTKYATSSRTWAMWGDWAAQLNPNALILIHTPCDQDAPVGVDALFNDDDHAANPTGNAGGWQYVAPHFQGWLIQLCGFVDSGRDPVKVAQWRANLGAYFTDADQRFRHGKNGWPTGSRYGPNVPLELYYGEGSSYVFFNDPTLTEDEVRSYGDIAMAHGADGYLDAGSVAVP